MRFFWLTSFVLLGLGGCTPNTETLQNASLAETDAELMALDLQNNQHEAARAHLEDAESLAPEDAQVEVAAGYFNEAMGDKPAAEKAYTKAIDAAPYDPTVENEYGRFLYQTGRYAEAFPYFQAAAQNPENAAAPEATQNAGFDEAALHDSKAAHYYFAKAELESGS